MPGANLVITISAKDMASTVLRQLGSDAKKSFDKSIKGLEKYQESLKKTGKIASSMGKKMSIGVTAPLALFAGVAVNSAVKAERLTQTLDGLAGGADKAAGFITAIKDASMGTIPQVEALEIANKALSFGVVSTEEGMASLVETAIVLGKAQGLDAATAVSDLTTALARQSPMILDNLGITLKMSEATSIAAEHAHEFGLKSGELTKAQEFQVAAMVKGQEAAARMGGMQEDMATKTERVKAQMADLTTTLGASLIPVMQKGISIIGPLVQGFSDASPAMQSMVIAMAAMAAGMGPALAAFGTITSAAGAFAAAITAAGGGLVGLKAIMTGTTASFLAVGVAVLAVTAAVAKYNAENEKVAAAANESTKAALGMTQQMAAWQEEGMSLSSVLSTAASRTNEATAAWDDMSNAAKVGAKVFGAQDKMTKTLMKTQQGMTQIIIKGSESYQQAVANIDLYNSQLDSSSAKLGPLTESQFKLVQSLQEQGVSLDNLFPKFAQHGEAIGTAMRSSADYDAATFGVIDSTEQLAETTSRHASRLQERNRAMDDGTGKTMANAEVLATHLQVAEKAARVADMQAESSNRQAIALEASRQAAIGAAEAQIALASSLMNATDAQVASTLIEQLDPEALGATAYAAGVEQIQLAFGLADEKSIAMASGVTELAAAINEGIIPYENYDEALAAVIADAADGQANTAALLDEFARAPGLIGPSKDKLESFDETLASTGESAIGSAEGVSIFIEATSGMAGDIDVITASVTRLNDELDKIGSTTLPIVPGSGIPSYQFGGVVPGPIGGPSRLVLAEPGEVFIPPAQQRNVSNNFGGNTQNVTINDAMALGLFEEQSRQDRLSRLSANL